jgi:hypothetical protein
MKNNFTLWIIGIFAIFAAQLSAEAQATIAFQPATTFKNTADIIDTGTLAYAMSFGSSDSGGVSVVLPSGHSVPFQEDNNTNPNVNTSNYGIHWGGGPGLGLGEGAGYNSTGDANFDYALNVTDYTNSDAQVTLNNLTPNTTYELQVFAEDVRFNPASTAMWGLSNTSGTPTSTINRDYPKGSDTDGTTNPNGAMQIGTFTTGASQTSETFYVYGDQPTAMVLDVVPATPVNTPAEQMSISPLYTQTISTVNGAAPLWTPVQHYRGNTFTILPDATLHAQVTRIDPNGVVTTVPLDPNPDYVPTADGHNRFTLGIDPNGYLHIIGDMHGYYPNWGSGYVHRYQNQNTMYWKSNKPLDVSGGFRFCGQGVTSVTDLPGLQWGGDSRFFNDRHGNLYYSGRVSAFNSNTVWPLGGGEPQVSYAIYKYNSTTGRWSSMGAQVPVADTYGTCTNFQTVLYWEYTNGFEAYQTSPRFDNNDRLYFSVAGNTAGETGVGLVFAYSDDFGTTWHKANGSTIPTLPIRGADGNVDQGDLVARSTSVPQQSGAYADKNGKIAVAGEIYRTWNGSAWVPLSAGGGVGYLGPDGMLTMEGGSDLLRSNVIDGYPNYYDTGYGQVFSTSELGLEVTGAIFGIGTPPGTNFVGATSVQVYEATFTPSANVTPSPMGVATSGGSYPSNQSPTQAFDENPNTKWYQPSGPTGWLQYDLGASDAQIVVQYEITSGNDTPTRDPSAWTFLGSNDGSTWTTLDTRSSQSFSGRNVLNSYSISNNTAYRYYRLNITANSGAGDLQIDDLNLIGKWIPLAPTIVPSIPDSGKVWLSWSASASAASYNVKRSTASGGPYTTIASGVTNNIDFTDTAVTNGTTYYYVVSAVNSLGEGANSGQIVVQPTAYSAAAPNLQPATPSNAQVTLTWSPLQVDGVGYNVKRATTSGGPYTTIASNVVSSTYLDTSLVNNTTYYYVVSTLGPTGTESSNSNEVSAQPTLWIRVDDPEMDIYGMPILLSSTASTWYRIFTGNPANYMETLSFNSVAGDTATFSFQGTAVRFISSQSGYGGTFDVALDGVYQTTGTDNGSAVQINLYENDTLSAGNHTLTITNDTNNQNTIDSFDYIPLTSGTANLATGGTATASTGNPPSEGAPQAFDGTTGTKWYTPTTAPGWLQYNLGAGHATVVTRYNVSSANDVPQRDPTNWQFQGSNDGTTWTTLDTETGQVFANRYQTNQYSFFNATAFQYYRLYITANAGGSGYGIQLSELSLMN